MIKAKYNQHLLFIQPEKLILHLFIISPIYNGYYIKAPIYEQISPYGI